MPFERGVCRQVQEEVESQRHWEKPARDMVRVIIWSVVWLQNSEHGLIATVVFMKLFVLGGFDHRHNYIHALGVAAEENTLSFLREHRSHASWYGTAVVALRLLNRDCKLNTVADRFDALVRNRLIHNNSTDLLGSSTAVRPCGNPLRTDSYPSRGPSIRDISPIIIHVNPHNRTKNISYVGEQCLEHN